ncbi:MAG: alcohol dehydrogenase catalytic domain-containing protein [Terriglobia bacterium]
MQKTTMKAVYLTGLRQMEVGQAPAPRISGPHDVLLRVDTLGVCGSDIHYYTQGRIGPQAAPFPLILGHELAATVMELGAEVKNLHSGQRVAVDPLIPCGQCDQCRAGRQHTCRKQKFLGNPGQAPGALAEYLVMPAACCSPVPDSLSDDEAAVVEPLSIGVYAAQMAQLAPGARVGIVGSGPIGLCTLLAIRARTQATVYATDLVDERLAMARACGAAWTGNPRRENVVAAIQHLEPLGLDAVFECAGEQDALDQGVELLKPGGALLVIGIPEVDRISFNHSLMRRNELRILNVRRQNACVEPAIELIASGRADVRPLITHHFQMEEAARAFELVSARTNGVVKAIIRIS